MQEKQEFHWRDLRNPGDAEGARSMVFRSFRLIREMAERARESGLREEPLETLLGEGVIGLVRAVETYDATSDGEFAEFCRRSVQEYVSGRRAAA